MNRPESSHSWLPLLAFAAVAGFVAAMVAWLEFAGANPFANALPWVISVTVASAVVGYFVGTSTTRRRIRSSLLENRDLIRFPSRRTASAAINKRREIIDHVFGKAANAFFANRGEIRHFMSRDIQRVEPSDSVKKVAMIMDEEHVDRVFVCDDGFQLLGIVSKDDLRERPGLSAEMVMTTETLKVSPSDTLETVADVMQANNISYLPVCLDTLLVGQIDTMDLIVTMECALDVLQGLASELREEVTG